MVRPRLLPPVPSSPLTPPEVYAVLSKVRPPDSVIVNESTSTMAQQALWTAAQHQLPVVYVVMRNEEYSILKSFAVLEETPGVPGLDLPRLGVSDLARGFGFGCRAVDVATAEDLEQEFKTLARSRRWGALTRVWRAGCGCAALWSCPCSRPWWCRQG